jgi:hypothetical protein
LSDSIRSLADWLLTAHRLLRWPQQRHSQPLTRPRSSWCWRTMSSRRSSRADRLCALRGAFWCSNDWFELCSACAGRASPDCISLLVRRPRARHPRHYTLTQQWCAQRLAVSRGEPRSTPRLHSFTAADTRCLHRAQERAARVLTFEFDVESSAAAHPARTRHALLYGAEQQSSMKSVRALRACCHAHGGAQNRQGGDATTAAQPHMK